MPILTLGISFRRAPIELLERLSFVDDELVKAYRHVLDLDAVEEAVILSTCNGVEIYADVSSYHAGFLALKRVLTETRGVASDELAEPLYSHWERDAAEHLFAIAAGLDSMVIGETPLALAQAEEVRLGLSGHGIDSEIVPMSTSGDEGAPSVDAPAGLKGLFVDTILDALERHAIDVAVHSAKDLPAEDDDGLVIAAVPPRADPADVLVLRDASLRTGAVIGTSSIRRRAQLLRAFPGVTVSDLRGNVDTRLRKVNEASDHDESFTSSMTTNVSKTGPPIAGVAQQASRVHADECGGHPPVRDVDLRSLDQPMGQVRLPRWGGSERGRALQGRGGSGRPADRSSRPDLKAPFTLPGRLEVGFDTRALRGRLRGSAQPHKVQIGAATILSPRL